MHFDNLLMSNATPISTLLFTYPVVDFLSAVAIGYSTLTKSFLGLLKVDPVTLSARRYVIAFDNRNTLSSLNIDKTELMR